MSTRRRPPRAWLGVPRPVDPAELLGPRGLTADVLAGRSADGLEEADVEGTEEPEGLDDAFYASLITAQRLSRIEAVIAARLRSVTAVLDQLIDPHNVAAVLRSAEGLGLCELHLVPHAAEDRVAHRRVTKDADKWIDLTVHQSGAAAAQSLRARGFEVWAGHLGGAPRPLDALPSDRPLAVLFGNEHEGPSAETLAACTGTFCIPMAGFTQSFNVSVAAAVTLHHASRARRAFLGRAGDLDGAALGALRSRYQRLGAKLARRLTPPSARSPRE